MPCARHLRKKAMGWPYIVGLIIGLIVLLVLLLLTFKGKGQISVILESLRSMLL